MSNGGGDGSDMLHDGLRTRSECRKGKAGAGVLKHEKTPRLFFLLMSNEVSKISNETNKTVFLT